MFVKTAISAAVLGSAVFGASAVSAQQSCAPRDALVGHLGSKYEESQVAGGLRTQTEIVEVWRSEQGSWTILVTDARGVSCIMAAGTHWREIEPSVELSGIQG